MKILFTLLFIFSLLIANADVFGQETDQTSQNSSTNEDKMGIYPKYSSVLTKIVNQRTSVQDVVLPVSEEITVFPNPANRNQGISITNIKAKTQIAIINPLGGTLASFTAEKNGTEVIDLSGINPGAYFIYISVPEKEPLLKRIFVQ